MRIKGITDSVFLPNGEYPYYIRIRYKEILYVEADSNYCRVQTKSKVYVLSQTLTAFQNELPADMFSRVNKSALVQTDMIEEVRGNDVNVNGKWFTTSKARRKELFI